MHALAQSKLSQPWFAAGLVFCVILTACSMSTTVVFENLSGEKIVVAYKDEKNQAAEFRLEKGEQVKINHLLDVHFWIKTEKSIQNYERATVPEEYIQNVGFGPFMKRVVKANLENDGCIYIVQGKKDNTNTRAAQPSGFPLCPYASSK